MSGGKSLGAARITTIYRREGRESRGDGGKAVSLWGAAWGRSLTLALALALALHGVGDSVDRQVGDLPYDLSQ